MPEPEESLLCLDRHKNDCRGTVEYREPLSPTGIPYPRCDLHWSERLEIQDGINRRYPEHPPSDWSPLDAGESWYEEE